MVHNCLHLKAPQYLMDCCLPISDVASRQHVHSTSCHHLVMPWHSLSTYGRRAFTVAGPAVWNSLNYAILHLALTISDICWNAFVFRVLSTNTYSALVVLHICTLYIYDLFACLCRSIGFLKILLMWNLSCLYENWKWVCDMPAMYLEHTIHTVHMCLRW